MIKFFKRIELILIETCVLAEVLRVLLHLHTKEDWEVRQSAMLVLQYIIAVRKVTIYRTLNKYCYFSLINDVSLLENLSTNFMVHDNAIIFLICSVVAFQNIPVTWVFKISKLSKPNSVVTQYLALCRPFTLMMKHGIAPAMLGFASAASLRVKTISHYRRATALRCCQMK